MRVLIAEDDPSCIIVLRVLLKNLEHEIIASAATGVELLDLFKMHRNDIDLIITDIMMPQMNGLEAVREIKKIQKIPCVATTALDHDLKVADNNGVYIPWTVCDFFVRKPLSRAALTAVLESVAEQLER